MESSGTILVPEAMFGSIVLWYLGFVLTTQAGIASKGHADIFSTLMPKTLCQVGPISFWSLHCSYASNLHVGSTVELTLMTGVLAPPLVCSGVDWVPESCPFFSLPLCLHLGGGLMLRF